MNWGYKIMIVYGLFMAFILSMVFRSCDYNVELVTEDYYAEELAYEKKMDKIRRTKKLERDITWSLKPGGLALQCPHPTVLSGEIKLVRPSRKDWDVVLPLDPNASGVQMIPSQDLHPGWYHLQIDWSKNDEEYFTEARIFIPFPDPEAS